jgi:hypothetical protein
MTDWKADLHALVQETMAFAKNNRVEPPNPRTIAEPPMLHAIAEPAKPQPLSSRAGCRR